MEDREVIECVAAAAGVPSGAAAGARVSSLGGKQGLLVCRVELGCGQSFVFKVVKESARREVALAELLSRIVPDAVPRVVAAEQDCKRGLYWLVCEDVGTRRLADEPLVEWHVATAVTLARLQLASIDHLSAICEAGAPVVDCARWEEIGLRLLEALDDSENAAGSDKAAVEDVIWSVTSMASDASACPLALVHGDLHAGNVALRAPDYESGASSVRLLDWGSAYVGAAFLGLEELLWPAARFLRTPDQWGRVRAAYLREWARLLGKPGPLEKAVAACAALVRLELLDEAVRRPHQFDAFAAASIQRRLIEAFEAWRRA